MARQHVNGHFLSQKKMSQAERIVGRLCRREQKLADAMMTTNQKAGRRNVTSLLAASTLSPFTKRSTAPRMTMFTETDHRRQ